MLSLPKHVSHSIMSCAGQATVTTGTLQSLMWAYPLTHTGVCVRHGGPSLHVVFSSFPCHDRSMTYDNRLDISSLLAVMDLFTIWDGWMQGGFWWCRNENDAQLYMSREKGCEPYTAPGLHLCVWQGNDFGEEWPRWLNSVLMAWL